MVVEMKGRQFDRILAKWGRWKLNCHRMKDGKYFSENSLTRGVEGPSNRMK